MNHDGSYYNLPPDCDTVTDVIYKMDMCYGRGNIMKAAMRWEKKGVSDDPLENKIYNLEKIKWYADYMLRAIYAEEKQRALDRREVREMQNDEAGWDR